MTQELLDFGIDYNDAMERFLNNEGLYLSMLKKLPEQFKRYSVLEHIRSGDIKAAVSGAHTLKGVVGCFSIKPLYEAYSKATALLREGKAEEAESLISDILPTQERLVEYIEKQL